MAWLTSTFLSLAGYWFGKGFIVLLVTVVGPVLARLGLTLLVSFAAVEGADAVVDMVRNNYISLLSGLPADAVGLLGLTKLDVALLMVLHAYVFRLTWMLTGQLTRGSAAP